MIKSFYKYHQEFWTKKNIQSLCLSVLILVIALVLGKFADDYVAGIKGIAVGDLVLDNLPVVNIDGLIIVATILFTFAPIILGLYKPKYLNFGIKAFALFVIVRSLSITLTHLGAHPDQIAITPSAPWFQLYNFLYNSTGDFFFSGHTGVPFLIALISWPEKPWRYFFIATSALFGAMMLVAHIHYSIDVFAAPFMTYGIYSLGVHLFPRDYKVSRAE